MVVQARYDIITKQKPFQLSGGSTLLLAKDTGLRGKVIFESLKITVILVSMLYLICNQ
jgi:hypothetical protein